MPCGVHLSVPIAMSKKTKFGNLPWIAALLVIAVAVFLFVFNPKPDFNGDNCYYFANATSLAEGKGYSDIFGEPTSNFPPGYPLLMTPLRMVTDSIVAQKVLNLCFLFASVVMLYLLLVGQGFKRSLAFLAGAAVLVTPHILEFSTIMMSEASCILFIVLSLWLYTRLPEEEAQMWRSPLFYLFLFVLVFVYHIRTQAIAVVAAFIAAVLFERRWRTATATAAAFVAGCLPWILRNALLDVEQSRYVSQIDFSKFLDTAYMLLFKAIPESIIPFININYKEELSVVLFLFAVQWLGIIIYGFCKMGRLRVPLLLMFVATIIIVSSLDTPSSYRYLIILFPLLTAALFVGLWSLGTLVFRSAKREFPVWTLSLLFVPMFLQTDILSKHTIWGLYVYGRMPLPSKFHNYREVSLRLAEIDRYAIVATRKPELFYIYSGVKARYFLETTDEAKLIENLLDGGVKYVVLDQLGMDATFEYLYPCVRNHPEFFTILVTVKNPDTYLLYFDRDRARQWLKHSGN